MSTYYLTVPLEYTQGYYEITFSQLSPHYVGELKFIETGGSSTPILNFSNLTQVDENTFTTTDEKGNTHTLIFTYNDDGSIKTATYDGKNVTITYDNSGNLVEVGNSDIDVSLYPDPEPSGNIGYQVTFKVDGNDYYVASCQQGESITEPPVPVVEGKNFDSWQLNGTSIALPYTPNEDVEFTAKLMTVRTEMEITTASTVLANGQTKTNDGTAVCGLSSYWYSQYGITMTQLMLLAKDENATKITSANTHSGSLIYNGETWYYTYTDNGSVQNINEAFYNTGTWVDATTLATKTLDHYFYND